MWKKSNIDLPHLSNLNFLTNHKTKEIEKRKLLIEQFLQKVLSSELLIKADKSLQKEILSQLNIDENFYQLSECQVQPDDADNNGNSNSNLLINQIISQSGNLEENKQNLELSKSDIKSSDILYSAAQIYLVNNKFQQSKRFTIQPNYTVEEKTYPVFIECLDNQVIKLTITKTSRAQDVCEEIGKQKNLTIYQDFRLFLIDSKRNSRVLDKDEVLYK